MDSKRELKERYKKQMLDYDQEISIQGYRDWLRNNGFDTVRPLSETERAENTRHSNKIGGLGLRMLTPLATLGAIAGTAYLAQQNKGGMGNVMGSIGSGGRVGKIVRDHFGNPVQGNDLNFNAKHHIYEGMGYNGEAHGDIFTNENVVNPMESDLFPKGFHDTKEDTLLPEDYYL